MCVSLFFSKKEPFEHSLTKSFKKQLYKSSSCGFLQILIKQNKTVFVVHSFYVSEYIFLSDDAQQSSIMSHQCLT